MGDESPSGAMAVEDGTADEADTAHDAVAATAAAATDEEIGEAEPGAAEDTASDAISADDGTAEPAAAAATAAPPATVAALIARQLRGAGVRFAFTVPGESFLALLEAFADEGIRVVTTRHESGAAFMAEAYGQLTGRPAVVVGTRAVGAANMAIGIHTARQDSTPMVVIVGQVQRRYRGREAFQEVDQVQSFGRLAKWATEISDRNAVPNAVDEVLRHLRTGRPGPVLLSVPEDLLDEPVPATQPTPVRGRTTDLDPSAVRSVLHLLAGAKRPVILAGAGVLRARATNDLVQFAEMLEVPVIASWRRADAFPNHHRLYLGMSGLGSASTVQPRLREADALLVLGSRLNEIASFEYAIPARGQRWAHVDLEPRNGSHGLSAPTIAVTGDVRSFLRSAIERLKGGALEAALVDARAESNRADREAYEAASVVDAEPWDGPGVHPGRVVATLGAVLPPDTILTTDAGNFASWAARGYKFRRPATFIGPTSGAMGYGFPAAIAAALARPNRPSIALAGDGGFAMTMSELETAVRERARVVAIVFDNQRYGTIRAHQERRGKGAANTDLGPIDFAAAAEAFGARGVRVETDEQFEPSLREALAHGGPSVLHLTLDRRWLAIDRVLEES
jgi:acetolactate synthase-1/2/3 large subunit